MWSANTGVHLTRMDMYVGIRDLKVPLDGTHVIVHLTDKAVVPILQLLNGKVEEVKFSSETTLDGKTFKDFCLQIPHNLNY